MGGAKRQIPLQSLAIILFACQRSSHIAMQCLHGGLGPCPVSIDLNMASRWNVTLPCLWLLLAVYRAACASCDECENQILPGQLLFVPKQLLSSGSCLTVTVATWRGCSHLWPRELPVPSSTVLSINGWYCSLEMSKAIPDLWSSHAHGAVMLWNRTIELFYVTGAKIGATPAVVVLVTSSILHLVTPRSGYVMPA